MDEERIGFTGTQRGMTEEQYVAVADLVDRFLAESQVAYASHGGCIGADEDFHAIVQSREIHTVVRPGDQPAKRFPVGFKSPTVTLIPPMGMMDRNNMIVNNSSLLIATPKGKVEERRSGTWATIRRARKRGIPVWMVWPDGSVEVLREPD